MIPVRARLTGHFWTELCVAIAAALILAFALGMIVERMMPKR